MLSNHYSKVTNSLYKKLAQEICKSLQETCESFLYKTSFTRNMADNEYDADDAS